MSPGDDGLVGDVRRDPRLDAERARDEAAIVRLARFGCRDHAELHLVAQERIVAREERKTAVADAIDARVADVREDHPVVVEDRRRQRGAHAAVARVQPTGLVNRMVGSIYALAQRKQWGMLALVCVEPARGGRESGQNGFGGHPARDFPGAVSAHAICQCENAMDQVDRNAVLVVLANAADVRQRRHFEEIRPPCSRCPCQDSIRRMLSLAAPAMKVLHAAACLPLESATCRGRARMRSRGRTSCAPFLPRSAP